MTITTIKVAEGTRDRLKRQAELAHRTLGQHLAHLADLGERQLRLAALRDAWEQTSPEDRQSYRAETALWDAIEHG